MRFVCFVFSFCFGVLWLLVFVAIILSFVLHIAAKDKQCAHNAGPSWLTLFSCSSVFVVTHGD
jgi:hypothetical protein